MPSFPPSLPLHHSSNAQQQPLASSIHSDDDAEDMNLGNGVSSRAARNSGHPFKSLTPKRVLAIAAALIFVVFFFGRSSGGGRDGYSKSGTAASTDKAPNEAAVQVDKLPPNSPQKQQSASSGKCTPPEGLKATTYALMIDAGSTGSRIHVYTFSHCDPDPKALPKLENEGFFMTKPGLSSYAGKPREAAESLRGLMEHAIEGVPESERSCTPIAVKATAGLRLLGARQSQEILDEVERWLKEDWPFAVVKDGVVVMDGRDEGVYAWITINFLLGLIGPDQPASAGTAAIMDLGGASTQIVFEPIYDPGSRDKLAPGDHVYDLDFAGADHVLYQHSHLGYGLMQARRAVHNLVAFSYVWQSAPKGNSVKWEDLTPKDKIHNPCMFKGETKVVKLDPPGREEVEVTMVGTGAGFEACRRVVEVMIAKDAACEKPPCAFAGVYQPKMGEVFSAGKVWALSYFYDRIAPLGLSSPFSISALRQLTTDVCAGREASSWSRFKNNKEAMEELSDRPEYCLDLTFMYSLLSLGYELDEERQVWMGKKVGNVELGWALGAALAMIEGHLSCRAD
ncbi:hypothetical protein NBRC10512_000091 [Rhodotorula toruloides]|uniref:guanosine-diphosphatase n=2 Tax=Rhodotorula toruloides TaxID=5286 RepID=A0A061B3R3_RHOTO|nr:guanosine-diphosphatase [Rhodotorula toruloides NP11]EMS19950.1 guanosine-diphosphatase [Rhodotorula toruloides NP11]CDR44539.1 RHTO0S09e05842g1_1 [Rhodotorula toruloides]